MGGDRPQAGEEVDGDGWGDATVDGPGTLRPYRGGVFQDLDETLAQLVQDEFDAADLEGVQVSFAGPDDQFPPSGVTLPAISFFLYDIRENLDLRSTQWEFDQEPPVTRRRPPVRLDCSYLITAWPNENAPKPVEDEHRMLGVVVRALLRHRRIPERFQHGEVAGPGQPLPARLTAEGPLQSIGEFWQAMGGRPKATVHYTVTVAVDVYEPVEVDSPPRVKKLDIHPQVR